MITAMTVSSGWAVNWLPYLIWTAVIVGFVCGIVTGVKAQIRKNREENS